MSQLAPSSQPTQSASVTQSVSATESSQSVTATETAVFEVEGMMCAGCVSTVEKKLLQCEGVQRAAVNLITEVAAVDYAPGADLSAIADALTVAGYPSHLRQNSDSGSRSGSDSGGDSGGGPSASQDLQSKFDWVARKEEEQQGQTKQIAIAGLLLLLSTLGHLQHLNIAKSSPLNAWLTLPIISTLWFHGILATLVLIFPARKILIEGFQGIRRGSPNMNTLVSLGALSAYTTSLAALIFPSLGWECFFDEPVMLLSFILIGRTLEQRARFRAASSLRSLIALQPAQARLMAVSPDQLSDEDLVLTEIEDVQIPVSQVKVGDWLRVLPGEKIPVDGVITRGQTTLDESMITGESLPAFRQTGDQVSGGMLNQSGAIALKVSRTGSETTLGQMIQLVETAQTRKAPIQGLADLISGYFTYGVLLCAALTFGFWYVIGVPLWPDAASAAMGHAHHLSANLGPSLGGLDLDSSMDAPVFSVSHLMTAHLSSTVNDLHPSKSFRLLVSLKLAIAVVVVACPCALGLATPTAILVGSGIGAEQGLLIRGGDILEATRQLDILVFDKTGTLTSGRPQVTDCLPLGGDISDGISADDLLQIAATVEKGTQHPLAVAIAQAAETKCLSTLAAEDFYTQAGLGISATLKGPAKANQTQPTQVWLGNLAWMQQNHCAIADEALGMAEALAESGKTAVFVAQTGQQMGQQMDQQTGQQMGQQTARQTRQLIGLIGVSDTLRPEAIETVEQIQKLGIEVQILSGDRLAAASAIAHQLGLSPSQVQAEVSPEKKVSAIRQLQQTGKRVGLVGDGINDAPALAQADVGIALNSGTDVAMETADIVLMKDTLTDVPAAIRLSRRTFNKIRQNLGWAFAYNLICIPLAAGVFLPAFGLSLSPGFAGGLMALSSITVVLNSLLLKVRSPALL
ncbi:MAG: heavy metal translocating P-type ATPase [Phormidesmis sp.]